MKTGKEKSVQNVQISVENQVLTIKVDLSKRLGKSTSGKTTIVATTAGNVPVPEHEGMSIGLNVYTR